MHLAPPPSPGSRIQELGDTLVVRFRPRRCWGDAENPPPIATLMIKSPAASGSRCAVDSTLRIGATMVETLNRAVTAERQERTSYLPRRLEVGSPLAVESGRPLLGRPRRTGSTE
jgi:hypothetical protein